LNSEITNLFKKHYHNQCSAAELDQVMEFFAAGDHQQEWDHVLAEEAQDIIEGNLQATMSVQEVDNLHHRIMGSIEKQVKIVKFPANRNRKWMAIAASMLLIASFSFYFYTSKLDRSGQHEIVYANDVAPGKNGATLTLANGQQILINDALAGNIATQSGVKISKTADGQLVYEITDNGDGKLAYNTLSTTRGQQTQVKLPDGTIVFLNAESALKYPTSFAQTKNRLVSLIGEAYFEVAKDKLHPFVVEADQQTVEVLGTTFNINSYTDETAVKTTLLEGSVKILNLNSKSASLLKPGEQSIINAEKTEIKPVETDDVVAWKKGYFMFNNETLENIMKKVSRWYDVEVIYRDNSFKKKTFFGSVSRFDNVSELLKLLQKTEGATFEIMGRQIIVGQKK
jgi:transmembrane sensor